MQPRKELLLPATAIHVAAQISLAVWMDRSWDKYFDRTRIIAIIKERIALHIRAFRRWSSRCYNRTRLAVSLFQKLGELIDTSDFEDEKLQ